MSLIDGRIVGVMAGRRLMPWETLSGALVAALAPPPCMTGSLPPWLPSPAALGAPRGQMAADAGAATDTDADPPS